jgi:hypothetical protein
MKGKLLYFFTSTLLLFSIFTGVSGKPFYTSCYLHQPFKVIPVHHQIFKNPVSGFRSEKKQNTALQKIIPQILQKQRHKKAYERDMISNAFIQEELPVAMYHIRILFPDTPILSSQFIHFLYRGPPLYTRHSI